MAKTVNHGGGWRAIKYSINTGRKVGFGALFKTLQSKNTCKACAFGTGGQNGGIKNETGKGIEVCKKNFQAQLTDLQPAIKADFFKKYSIADLQKFSGHELELSGRLTLPLYKAANDTHYSVVSYDMAIKHIVKHIKNTDPNRSFFYSSGRSSNEAAFLLQLFARIYGTNNVNNCSFYCHQASGEGLNAVIGSGTATIRFDDLHQADLFFVFGANPSSNHPRFLTSLYECRQRGGSVVIVNPIQETGLVRFAIPSKLKSMAQGGSEIASHYIQPHIGGDIAFIKALAKSIIERQNLDTNYINSYTEDFEAYKQEIANCSWEELCRLSGIEKAVIEQIAALYSKSRKTIFAWGMGLTHHLHGVNNVEALAALALLRGMVGKEGAGLLPLRGHSNVQGIGSVGVTPKLKEIIFKNLQNKMGLQLPVTEGWHTMACMEAAHNKQVDFAFMLGGNLYASNPDAAFAQQALDNIPLKVFLSPTLNTGHFYGVEQETFILPVRVRDEERQTTTQESMFNYVRMSNGGINRFKHLWSETDIISKIAIQVIDKQKFDFEPYQTHNNIRKAIAQTVPGLEQLEHIDHTRNEFHINNRTFYTPQFPTPNGKARFCITPTPLLKQNNAFLLMTIRSEGQFNSIVYETTDIYRNQTERWVVLMNPQDMQEQGFAENQAIQIYNSTGRMENVKVKPFNIKQGNIAMYYPEANVLVPRQTDDRSKTPAFKSVIVFLEK